MGSAFKEKLDKFKQGLAPETQQQTIPLPQVKVPRIKDVIAYYYPEKNDYYTKNNRGQWLRSTETQVKRILRYDIFPMITDKEYQAGVIDRFMMNLQREHDVAWAGQIAGYRTGLHEICGQRILVTSTNRPIKPHDGKWPLFRKFIAEMLGDDANYFFAWVKASLRSFYAGPPFRPGQMLVLCGPGGCGKSFLQNVITAIFGGRGADPTRYMFDKTDFNRDMIASEHLAIEDSAHDRSAAARRAFAAKIKETLVKETQSLHKKGADALMVSPFWRMTLSLNDEPENLRVLPPLDESVIDKLIIFKCFRASFPYEPDDLKGRAAYRDKVIGELPCFLRWLQGWRIPKAIEGQRYGVRHYHHPDIVKQLLDMQPEMKLWALIHELKPWGVDNTNFVGYAHELTAELYRKDKYNRVSKLLEAENSCGTFLARLAKLFPTRVKGRSAHDHTQKWEVSTPDREVSL